MLPYILSLPKPRPELDEGGRRESLLRTSYITKTWSTQ
jgi:hypothetical protein